MKGVAEEDEENDHVEVVQMIFKGYILTWNSNIFRFLVNEEEDSRRDTAGKIFRTIKDVFLANGTAESNWDSAVFSTKSDILLGVFTGGLV